MPAFGEELVRSAREALAIARREAGPARAFVPPPIDVATIRRKTGLSQAKFARRCLEPADRLAVRDWRVSATA